MRGRIVYNRIIMFFFLCLFGCCRIYNLYTACMNFNLDTCGAVLCMFCKKMEKKFEKGKKSETNDQITDKPVGHS